MDYRICNWWSKFKLSNFKYVYLLYALLILRVILIELFSFMDNTLMGQLMAIIYH